MVVSCHLQRRAKDSPMLSRFRLLSISIPCFLLLGFVILLVPERAKAQTKLAQGEEVMVSTFHGWEKGIVVEVGKKKQYLIEYTFAGLSTRREVFHRNAIRRFCEYRAMGFCRKWKSTDSKFEIDAALLRFKSADEIVLRDPEMNELDVKTSLLSQSDQTYLKRTRRDFDRAVLAGMVPGGWPTLPPLESFDTGFAISMFTESKPNDLVPFGKLPSYLAEFEEHGVGFNLIRRRQELASAVAVGGPNQLVLVNGREASGMFQSQLYWLSMKQEKVLSFVSLPTGDLLLDYDPRTQLLVTFNQAEFANSEDDPSHVSLWKLGFEKTDPEPIARWSLAGNLGLFGTLEFGKIITDNIVLTKGKKGQYIGWNVQEKKIEYVIRSEHFFDAPARLSADRRHLIVPEGNRINVYDAATGEIAMGVDVDDSGISGANVNASGTKLAAVSSRKLFVWNLEVPGSKPQVFSAPMIASPFESAVDFVDDEKVIVDGIGNKVMFSLRLGVPLWTYVTKDPFFNSEPLVCYVVDGVIFYTEQDFFRSQMVAVGAVQLPGPAVNETTAAVDRADLMIVAAGSHVALDLGNVSAQGQVESWLVDKIKANGWILDQDAEIVLSADMGVGPTTRVQYYAPGSRGRKVTSISFQPHYSTIKLVKGDLTLWSAGTQTSPPSFVRTGPGSSIQNRVDAYQRPNIGFFRQVKIESEILDPKYSYGFGVSMLGRQGIEVVSTEPPGRTVNSLAAWKKFNKDREAAQNDRRATLEGADDKESSDTNNSSNRPPATNRGQRPTGGLRGGG